MDQHSDEFITLLTASQASLYGCILALLPDRTAAHDVLQEVNLTLWHKAGDFEPGTQFLAWASRIAHFHVLNYRRRIQRDRLVFDEELLTLLADRQLQRASQESGREEALRRCLDELPDGHRELIAGRYAPGASVQQLAEEHSKSVGAISQMLCRLREALLRCIESKLRTEPGT